MIPAQIFASADRNVISRDGTSIAYLTVGDGPAVIVIPGVARNNGAFRKIAVYESGVSVKGSMPTAWMPGYERALAQNRTVDAFVAFTLAVAPPRIGGLPRWLMKLSVLALVRFSGMYRQMLTLLAQNLREWQEIARLDNTCENYREIAADVLLMSGTKSDSPAVSLANARLAAILPRSASKEFPGLDHFGIERTAPRDVANAIGDWFLKM